MKKGKKGKKVITEKQVAAEEYKEEPVPQQVQEDTPNPSPAAKLPLSRGASTRKEQLDSIQGTLQESLYIKPKGSQSATPLKSKTPAKNSGATSPLRASSQLLQKIDEEQVNLKLDMVQRNEDLAEQLESARNTIAILEKKLAGQQETTKASELQFPMQARLDELIQQKIDLLQMSEEQRIALEAKDAKIGTLEDENKVLKANCESAEQKMALIEKENKQLLESEQRSRNLHDENERESAKKITILEGKVSSLKEQLTNSQSLTASLQKSTSDLKSQDQTLQTQLKQATAQLKDLQAQKDSGVKAFQALLTEKNQLLKERDLLVQMEEKERKERVQRDQEKNQQINELGKENGEIKKSLTDCNDLVEQLTEELQKANTKLQEVTTLNQEMTQELTQTKEDRDLKTTQLAKLSLDFEKLQTESIGQIDLLTQQRDAQTNNYQSAFSVNQLLKNEADSLDTELTQLKNQHATILLSEQQAKQQQQAAMEKLSNLRNEFESFQSRTERALQEEHKKLKDELKKENDKIANQMQQDYIDAVEALGKERKRFEAEQREAHQKRAEAFAKKERDLQILYGYQGQQEIQNLRRQINNLQRECEDIRCEKKELGTKTQALERIILTMRVEMGHAI
ncbi:hypothetical protein FGO68_gene11082 [Halteria grandinella]|uniref:Uncharacterized protein n=1 Tax=Halteria grandinella TaxID=5974 RepID=A0A8J8NUX1_HALGN|nr:hypothetical protein FGO68_gene11082 [Halteria grandinella]